MKKNDLLFSFVPDREFLAILDSDYDEFHKCLDAGCNKGAMIIVGSVVECLAIFSVKTLGLWPEHKDALLKASLADIINVLHEQKIIDSKTRDLSSVVREYRNLIHPGRVIRLQGKVSSGRAAIAASLVEVIAGEVSAAFSKKYGLTAEQLVDKIKRDPSAANLAKHHLRRMSDTELSRLVTEVVPSELADLDAQEPLSREDAEWNERCVKALSSLFASSLSYNQQVTCKAYATYYADVVRNGSENFINLQSRLLFQGMILTYLAEEDYAMVKDYWITNLNIGRLEIYKKAYLSLYNGLRNEDVVIFFFDLASLHKGMKGNEGEETIEDIMRWLVPFAGSPKEQFLLSIKASFLYNYHKSLVDRIIDEADDVPF